MSLRPTLLAVALLGMLSTPALQAQTMPHPAGEAPEGADIRGIVTDSTNGERILGVNVLVKGTRRGATSNIHGFYLIPAVPEGTYEIVLSAVGYSRRTVRVTVTGTEPMTLDIRLLPRLVEANEVVVRSERLSESAGRSASIHIMTPQEVKLLPAAAGQQDLLRSLQLLPGISSTSDASAKFYVRGGAGDQNLILLDGMKIYNPFHAFGLFSILDPDIVRNTEVYTGAFPAGYGNRLSSVVNVTTKDGNLSRLAGLANVNFLSGKLQLEGPVGGDNAWLVSGRTSLFGGTLKRMIPNPAPTTFYDLFAKGTIGTSTGRVGVRGYVSGDDVSPIAPEQPSHVWRNAAFAGVLSALVTDRLFLDATLSYSSAEMKRIVTPASPTPPAYSLLEEVNLRVELTSYTEGETTFHEGFEFSFPSIVDSLYTGALTPVHMKDTEAEWYVWGRADGTWGPLKYDLGLHVDFMLLTSGKRFLQGAQPRLTLSYVLGESWVAKASYGVFTQKLISVSNEDDLISLFDAWLYLPKDLVPEDARHYVLGLEGNIVPSLWANLQVYLKSYESVTLYNPDKVLPQEPDYINGTGEAYGAEASLRFSTPFVELYGAYTLSRITLTQDRFSYAPRYDRRHTVKAVATVHLLENLDATLRWDYGSGYPFTQDAGFFNRLRLPGIGADPFPGGASATVRTLGPKNAARLPAYHRLDAGLQYQLPLGFARGTIGVNLVNVYDAKNILYYDRATGKTDYMIPFFPTASLTVEF